MRRINTFAAVLAAVALTLPAVQAQPPQRTRRAPQAGQEQETPSGPRVTVPEDYYRVKRVGSTGLSPDGRYLLYTVQTVRRQQNDRLTEVWWADLQTGKNQRLSTAGVNTTSPGWVPGGRRIYFTTQRGDERGLHFLNFLEPGGEAYRLPGLRTNPTAYSPDGRWILYVERVAEGPADETPGRSEGERVRAQRPGFPEGIPALTRRMGAEWAGTTEEARNQDVYVITGSGYKRDGTLEFQQGSGGGGMGAFGRGGGQEDGRYTQFFRMPIDGLPEGTEPEQLTRDPWNKSFVTYTQDGRHIVYTVDLDQKEERPERDPEAPGAEEEEEEPEPPRTGVFLLPADGGEARQIHEVKGYLRGLAISRDNRRLAYSFSESRRGDPVVRIVTLADGKTLDVGQDWIYGFGGLTWSADGRRILATSQIGGQTQVMAIDATTGVYAPITSGRHSLGSLSFDRAMTKMAYVKNTAERPWEAFTAAINGSGEQQVSQVNSEWLAEVKLSRVERFTFEGAPHNEDWLDQLKRRGVKYMMTHQARSGERPEIENWLMYPVDYEEGKKYPLVLSIHGGPHSMYSETWFHEFQILAGQGMFVLYMNPRGSGGYGREFSNMIMEAWGIDDYKDYMQAVDTVVARGIVDETSMGVTGGSYGGYMTNWITAHDDRFKAAITARSICNWISFYGVSDASGLVESEFGGRPWPYDSDDEGSWQLATMLSPIVWADNVKTPTLIIHSINDYRCPMEEGEQWFRALKKNEVPVKMVLFPDSSHGLSRTGEPWLLVRRLQEYSDWFKAYLVDDEPVVDKVGPIARCAGDGRDRCPSAW